MKSGEAKSLFRALALAAACAGVFPSVTAALPAFPGAEGAGGNALGGRSGDVYRVTSLADTNTAGTLRNAISSAPAAGRTIVFDISGTINLTSELNVNKPKITIAGQTAPGNGITLKNYKFRISNSDVVVRHIRSRLGTDAAQEADTIEITGGTNVILDHVTSSWSVDETLSVTDLARNVSVQNSFITESLHNSIHVEGPHGYGSLLRADGVGAAGTDYSFHHNLYATHYSRNPRPGTFNTTDLLRFDFRNNVVYNWQDQAGYTSGTDDRTNMNYVGNYLVAGPLTPAGSKSTRAFTGGNSFINIYQSDNKIDSDHDGIHDGANTGWSMFSGTYTQQMSPYAMPGLAVTTDTPDIAYLKVLAAGGAFPWLRDAVDVRVTNQVLTETSPPTIIDSVAEAGGYPALPVVSRPAGWDTDNDGMPNWWETARGLNAAVDDHGLTTLTGPGTYTNLEHYLNYLTQFAAWGNDANGNWSTILNWRGMLPNVSDATSIFGSAITAPRTITVDAPLAVGQMVFDSAHSYTLSGGSAITIDVISGAGAIDVISGDHTISAPVVLNRSLGVNVAPADSTLTMSNLQPTSLSVGKTGAGELVVNNVRAGGLAITGGTVRVLQSGGTSKVASLAITSGKLDVTNNKLVVAGGDIGSWNGSAYTGVTGLIQAGRSDGSWNGNGIVTSMSDATSGVLTTLAVARAEDVGYAGGTFGGVSVSTGDVLVFYTWGGDADLNGELNGDDYFFIDSNVINSGSVFGFHNGDFDLNGEINGDDYFIIDSNISFAQSSPPFPTSAGGLATVPEPGTLLLGVAAAMLVRRRRA